jgi:hypothetical protein
MDQATTPSLLDGYLPEKETAKGLHKSTRWLKRQRDQRTGPPFIQVGRDYHYHIEGTRQWLQDRQIKPVRRYSARNR